MARLMQAILAFFISMITARYLGPSNFGVLNYAMSLVLFAIPIMKLGIHPLLVQELVYDPECEGEILGSTLGLNLMSAIVCIIGVNAFSIVSNPDERETIVVCALYSSILFFEAFEIFAYWFQAKLLAKYSSIVSLIAYLIVSIYKIYLLITQKSIFWFSISNTLDYLIIAIGLIVLYKHKGGKGISFKKTRALNLLSRGKYYILSDLMITIFTQTDRVMIKTMLSNASTGYYSAALTCASVSQFVFIAIIDSTRPGIFEAKKESEKKYVNAITRLFSIIIYLSLLQCVFITIFANPIIKVLYGSDYLESVNVLRVLVWYSTFSYLGTAKNIWILSEEKQQYLWKSNLLGAISNILLNILLIKYIGITGAAIASVITQFLTNVLTGLIFKPIRGVIPLMINALNPHVLLDAIKENKTR